MDDKVNHALVGAFVLALGAALVAGVLWLATGYKGKKQYDPYQSIVEESVAGLNIDAPVKYLGVNVGKVSSITINPDDPSQVRLTFLIVRGTPVKDDTDAVLKTQGLTGIAYVELGGGSAGSPRLVAGEDGEPPLIRTKPSLGARLETDVTSVLANVDRLTTNLNALLDTDNRDAIKRSLADIATLTHALAAQQGTISAGLADAARTARNTAQATEHLAPVVARLGPAIDQLGPALAQIGPAVTRIGAAAGAVEKMADAAGLASATAGRSVEAAASGVQQASAEAVPELVRLVAELNQLTISLRRLSEQTERHPTSLIVGAPVRPAGPGEKATP